MDVCCVVSEAAGRFNAAVIDEGGCSDLSNELFLAVCIRSEESGFAQAIQAAAMACAVCEFVERGAVIFSRAFKLCEEGKRNTVG